MPNSQGKSKNTRVRVTEAQLLARKTRSIALKDAIDTLKQEHQVKIANIATDHGRSIEWVRRQLFMPPVQKRGANPWNGFVAERYSNFMENAQPDERMKLTNYLKQHSEELKEEYNNLGDEELDELREAVEQLRKEKDSAPIRDKPKARLRDVQNTFDNMKHDWTGISLRTGTEGFYVAVRGSIDDYSGPKTYFSDAAASFFKSVLNVDPDSISLQFESWVTAGLNKQSSAVRPKLTPVEEKKRARELIVSGLHKCLAAIGEKSRPKMNYDNYERAIVETFSVELKHFPGGQVKQPGTLTRPQLQALVIALEDNNPYTACHWAPISETALRARIARNRERQEQGENIYVARKSHKKNTRARNPKSKEIVDSSSDDEGSDGDE